MKKLLHLLLLALPVLACAQSNFTSIKIIPKPVAMGVREGKFTLQPDTKVYFSKTKDEGYGIVAQHFMAIARTAAGFNLNANAIKRPVTLPADNAVYFMEDTSVVGGAEAYKLEVFPGQIIVRARSAAGAFYGLQTLRQLFPPAFFAAGTADGKTAWTAPCCTIEDNPRFGYRGLHLDVGRHFFNVEDVKRYIDLLAAHKLNVFHWHLTEDQGWRIEIPKYPRLQTAAACRKQTLVGHYSDQPHQFDGKRYCGFYTQKEVKDVIEYAKKRFVTIVPEIELPGHALAALAAYPELGCTGGPYEVGQKWGVFDEVLCAGNDKTFEFLENVLDEVARLFPGPYVHVGGDECPKTRWKTCPKCQKRMKDNGLHDEHELQSYVIRWAEKTLAKRGKKLIGWDEILEGGLAPSATVMSWRGIAGGIAAAKANHDVIMTPTDFMYFDYYQSDPTGEPLAIGGFLPLDRVYGYEPLPDDLTPEQQRYIIGVQANLWTEYISDFKKVEYMTWPRACALAEIAWTPRELKNWGDFGQRLKPHFARLEAMGVNFSKAFYDLAPAYQNGLVSLASNDPTMSIRYTLDGTEPHAESPVYSGPFPLEKSVTLKAVAFDGKRKIGKTTSVDYLAHKASGKPYTLSHQPGKYTGGETYALTNGVTGNLKRWNAWVALDGLDFDPVIDLGASVPLSRVSTHFLNGKDSWIYPPRSIEVLVSEDGKNFVSAGKKDIAADAMTGYSIENVEVTLPAGTAARYVKLVGKHFGKIPDAAPGGGNSAWIFLDEIVVE